MFVNFNILNQLGSPAINSNTFANRPAAGQTGRLFVSTDTFEIYRDNGTTWDLIGGPGTSTITGTGTATQVAYFTSSQAIGSSANLYWDNTNGYLGINTATPGAELDLHGTGIIQQINSTSATANSLLAFQRSGAGLWRIGDVYNGGTNYFEIYNTVLGITGLQMDAATNKTSWQSQQTYSTGLARGNYFDYNLSVPAATSFTSPNAITALGASLDLTLAGNATIPSGARTGLDAYNTVSFTGAGTLTMTQGTQIRPYSNITAGWAFNGSAVGTITHLAGLRILFPDNSGSTVNVTNNYALLINDQTANTGTVSYTSSRWGIYQEGASDLNYFAANTLIGTTVNSGNKLQVAGNIGVNTSGQTRIISTYYGAGTDGKNIYIGGGGLLSSGIADEGSYNVSLGVDAMLSNTTGEYNVAIGFEAMKNCNVLNFENIAIGYSVLQNITTGYQNTCVGGASGILLTTGYRNTAIGSATLFSATTGYFNVSIGRNALRFLTTGYQNVAVGNDTLYDLTTGFNNTAIGYQAGQIISTGSNNIYIGNATIGSSSSVTNEISIGYGSTGNGTNSVTLGNNSITKTLLFGNTLIGTTTDAGQKLQVNGVIYAATGLNINTTSTDSAQLKVNGTIGVNDYNQNTYLYVTGGVAGQRVSAFVGTYSASGSVTLATFSRVGGAVSADIKYDDSLSPLGISYGTTTNHALYFYTNNTTALLIKNDQTAEFTQSIKTAAPTTGTAAAWKLGQRVAAAVVLDATQYIEVEVGGTFYKLAIVT